MTERVQIQASALRFRSAVEADVATLVSLLADDSLGKYRAISSAEELEDCKKAFRTIAGSSDHDMLVVEMDGEIVGMLQISFIPGLSHRGAWRAQIESVRVAGALRGRGIGAALMKHAMGLCKARGARVVQLTSDVRRVDARRFYESLGFDASHVGFKLAI